MLAPSRSSWPHTAAKPASVQAPEAGSRGGGAGPLAGAGAGSPSTTDNGYGRRWAPAQRVGGARGATSGGDDAAPTAVGETRTATRKRTILLSTYLCHSCLLGNIRITPTHTGTNI